MGGGGAGVKAMNVEREGGKIVVHGLHDLTKAADRIVAVR